jgi:hypothetical protein
MKPKDFFMLITKSVNPSSYKDLASSSVKQTLIYFFGVLSLAFFVTALLYLPVLTDLSFTLNKGLSKFTKINIDVSVETSEPVYFRSIGLAVDTTGNITNITKEKVVMTDKHIMLRPASCLLFSPLCFLSRNKVKTISLGSKNLLDYKKDIGSLATTLTVLLIPTIVVSLYLMYLIKYVLMILFVSALTFLVTRLRLYEVQLMKTVKLAAYTITPMILIEVINLRFGFKLYFVPFVIFAVLFTIGIMLVGEKAIKQRRIE